MRGGDTSYQIFMKLQVNIWTQETVTHGTYRVPAKCLERRAMTVMFSMRPDKSHLRCMNAPCTMGITQKDELRCPTCASSSRVW